MIARAITLFPLWALLLSGAAWLVPAPFAALKGTIVYLLGIVMLGMGMTLVPADFTRVLRRPVTIALGMGMQYGLMPLAAWLVASALGLSPALLAGMVLVGASPGGTASNVICYLARGDVALSVSLTTVSTLLAPLATPLLTLAYAGFAVDVPVVEMFRDVLRIIVLPVALGVAVNTLFATRLRRIKRVFPLVSVLAIVVIIAIIVALNHDRLQVLGATVMAAVALHNLLGLCGGYWIARSVHLDLRTSRTLAIEVGMQNSGLAVALALKYFTPLSALPGALFSVWHNLSGALLAAFWSRRTGDTPPISRD